MNQNSNVSCPRSDVLLSLNNVSLKYKIRGGLFRKAESHFVLNNVSFDLKRGETLGIVGRNGAGKSTLLRVIAGIFSPDSGSVKNNGVSVSLLTLQAGFDKELSGVDNIILNGMLLGYSRKKALSTISEITEFSELGSFITKPVKIYSTGMRAKLGFSIALYLSPDVLLLDEVLSVGDKEFKIKARAAMTKKLSSVQSVVMVSHNENDIAHFCDRVITLKPEGNTFDHT